eukprot:1749664-Pleurochrysis_carterae.AAC.1
MAWPKNVQGTSNQSSAVGMRARVMPVHVMWIFACSRRKHHVHIGIGKQQIYEVRVVPNFLELATAAAVG